MEKPMSQPALSTGENDAWIGVDEKWMRGVSLAKSNPRTHKYLFLTNVMRTTVFPRCSRTVAWNDVHNDERVAVDRLKRDKGKKG